MTTGNSALRALRDAVRLSPDNIPLRQHFAETLLSQGLVEEAEREYRGALSLDAENVQLKLGLANRFVGQIQVAKSPPRLAGRDQPSVCRG